MLIFSSSRGPLCTAMGCAFSSGKQNFDTSRFYKRERLLDEGAVGEVFLEVDTRTNENVAVKYIPRNRVTYHVRREVLNFSACQHPQIISFREAFLTPTHLGISMEFADDGNLLDYVNSKGAISEDESRWLFQQVVAGVDHCHFLDIVLRDIKPENMLLLNSSQDSRRKLLKLCDFGTSVVDTSGALTKTSVGTLIYSSPEVLSHEGKLDGRKSDVWSIGVILFCMTFARHPFLTPEEAGGGNFTSAYKRISECKFKFPVKPAVSEELNDLLSKLLVKDPVSRLSIAQIYRHPWFNVNLPRSFFQKLQQSRDYAENSKTESTKRWQKLLDQAAV